VLGQLAEWRIAANRGRRQFDEIRRRIRDLGFKLLPRRAKPLVKRLLRAGSRLLRRGSIEANYARWIRDFDTLSQSDRDKIRAHIGRLEYQPLISVVMPVYEASETLLREAIESVRNQLYPRWELCIADDASKSPHVGAVLREAAAGDARIKWVRRETNGHICAASNSALALATGEFIALMDHDDLIAEHALYEVAAALNNNPRLDVIYSDEDQIDEEGRRYKPYFKTDWNIDLFLAHNIVSHLGVYRRTLLEQVGGFREGFEGSQDYDLALRCADETNPALIHHIPAVLYHWRRNHGAASFSESQYAKCSDAAFRAVGDHLTRRREKGEVRYHPLMPGWTQVARPIPDPPPLVSLIVPTRDQARLLGRCVQGLLHRTDYPNLEILIVDNDSQLPETFELFDTLKKNPKVRIIQYSGAFNYSAINNMAVGQANGSIIGLINNDIDVASPDWLSEMVSIAVLDGAGAVGAKLIYPNGRVQHGGIVLGVGGVANHFNHLLPRWTFGYFGRNVLTSSVSAVTGACLIVRKALFEEVGGLNETELAVSFNDVDFCLKLRKRGYRNVWTPHAELHHHESASRGREDTPEKRARFEREVRYMIATWGPELQHDPFYSDNFSTEIGQTFHLAFPPRRRRPWLE
jgi:GT2 family glycosyltransferase